MREADRYVGQFAPGFSRIHDDGDLWWVVPLRVRYILGVTGLRFTGKSLALAHLAERRGFRLYTLSMILREEAERLGQALTPRSALQDFGDRLRLDSGDPARLARLTLRRIRSDYLSHEASVAPPPRIAVGGFKRPEEVAVFESLPQFTLVGLTVTGADGEDDQAKRIGRGIASGDVPRELDEAGIAGDPYDAFQALDLRDRDGTEGDYDFGQAAGRLMENIPSADRIDNAPDGQQHLFDKLNRKVEELDRKYRLPRGL